MLNSLGLYLTLPDMVILHKEGSLVKAFQLYFWKNQFFLQIWRIKILLRR